MRKARKRAADAVTTFSAVVEEALSQYLSSRTRFRLRLLTKKGRRVPGVDLAGRDALYERMERRS